MIKYISVIIFALTLVACRAVTPFEVGQQEYVSGNYLKAAQVFSEHTMWNSDIKYEAMYYEGMCWFNLQSYDKAKKLFTNVIEHSENRVIKSKAIAAKAELCMIQGDCDGAISLYKMLLLAGYVDYYPQEEAYLLLKKAAMKCGNSEVLSEYDGRFASDVSTQPTFVSGLTRVRLENQFLNKNEAISVMDALKDAGVDSSLSRIVTPQGDYFVIQVGAFSNSENANAMAQKVFDLGWKVIVLD